VTLVDSRGVGRRMNGPVTDGIKRIESGKQPAALQHLPLGPGDSPPDTQAFEENGREHGVSVLATFTLFNAQGHAVTVDIADLERRHFAGSLSSTVGQ
jgi:hypothetical protein